MGSMQGKLLQGWIDKVRASPDLSWDGAQVTVSSVSSCQLL